MRKLRNTAFLFPSKGELYPGICMDYYRCYSKVREYFEKASEIHNFDFRKYLSDGNSDLNRPIESELATLLVSISKAWVLCNEIDLHPEIFSGLSMGLYTASIASGSLKMEDGFSLLKFSMESGILKGGKTVAISGLLYDEVRSICCCPELKGKVYIANQNLENQYVITGDDVSVDSAIKMAEGLDAIKCKVLYYGQFHAPPLKENSEQMFRMMNSMDIFEPKGSVLFLYNLREAQTRDDIKQFLCTQLYSPVKWYEGVLFMIEKGVRRFVEIGPGNLLTKMLGLMNQDIQCFFIDGEKTLGKVVEEVAKG